MSEKMEFLSPDELNLLYNLLVINDCSSNPCQNGGSCCEVKGGHSCTCLPNYTGKSCDQGKWTSSLSAVRIAMWLSLCSQLYNFIISISFSDRFVSV
jgi:hypothetical protein